MKLVVGLGIGKARGKFIIDAGGRQHGIGGSGRPHRGRAHQLLGDVLQALLDSRLARLPLHAAQPVELDGRILRAVARQHFDVLDGHIELVVALVDHLQAVMGSAANIEGLEPCPLCVFQRICVIVMGIIFLIAGFHHPGRAGATVYALVLSVAGGAGIAFAARQVWLQSLPPEQVPACSMGLNYMLESFPVMDVVEKVLKGSGECSKSWAFPPGGGGARRAPCQCPRASHGPR